MPPFLAPEARWDEDDIGLVGRPISEDEGAQMQGKQGIPLVGVHIKATALDFVAECKLIQCYHNTACYPVEAVYNFPLDNHAAVCDFEAEYDDGTVVRGEIQEKQQAQQSYRRAIQQGKQAQLLNEVRRDIFSIRVGNLPAGSYVKITITYVTKLDAREDAAALIFPTYVAPRYCRPSQPLSSDESQALAGHSNCRLLGMSFQVDFTCLSPIKSIECPTHDSEPSLTCDVCSKTGQLTLQNILMDREIVVLVKEEQSHQPRAIVEKSATGSIAGFVTLFPQLEFPDREREFIFLIDQSGSMGGTKMEQTRETLMLFLRALPETCTFNIIGFGSYFQALFNQAVPYSDESLEVATQYALNMQANKGGTEIKRPLEHIFLQALRPQADRQVFVLTDGQVGNDNAVFGSIRQACKNGKSRLFSMGLGRGVSRHLVEGMARAGRGTARFVEEGSAEPLQRKVIGQLKQSLQPAIHRVNIQWNIPKQEVASIAPEKTLLGYRSPDLVRKPMIFPAEIPPIFDKQRFLSFAIFADESALPKSVSVKCETLDGTLETTIPISQDDVFEGNVAHKMAAKAAINEYEDTKNSRDYSQPGTLTQSEVLRLALSNNLVSQQTSFVAVLDKDTCRKEDGSNEPTGSASSEKQILRHDPPVTVDLRLDDVPALSLLPSSDCNYGCSTMQVPFQSSPRIWDQSMMDVKGAGCKEEGPNVPATRAYAYSASATAPPMPQRDPCAFAYPSRRLASSSKSTASPQQRDCAAASVTIPAAKRVQIHADNILPNTGSARPPARLSQPTLLAGGVASVRKDTSAKHTQPWTSFNVSGTPRERMMLHRQKMKSKEHADYRGAKTAEVEQKEKHEEVEKKVTRTTLFPKIKFLSKKKKNAKKGQLHGLRGSKVNVSSTSGMKASAKEQAKQQQEEKHIERQSHINEQKKKIIGTNVGHAATNSLRRPMNANIGEPGDTLLELCLLQKANGSFEWNNSLADIVGMALVDMKAKFNKVLEGIKDKNVMATVIAVSAMRVLFGLDKEIWELQEQKACRFLARALPATETTSLLSAAETRLRESNAAQSCD